VCFLPWRSIGFPRSSSHGPAARLLGEDWLHEIKYDGYRLSARRDGQVCLYTRNGHDWTARLPEIASAVRSLPACYLDGELVAVDSQGVPTFEVLQRASRRQPGQRPLYFQVFDPARARRPPPDRASAIGTEGAPAGVAPWELGPIAVRRSRTGERLRGPRASRRP
jgi:hypothetical protein